MTAVRTTPTPRILLGIRNRRWTMAEALAELVDNSFGEGRGAAETVYVDVDKKRRTITVLDDGQGTDNIADLFTLGKGAPEHSGDIGRYGVGGSEALLWLGDKVMVSSLKDGLSSGTTVNWARAIKAEEFPRVDTGWRKATATNTPVELLALGHGTYIRVDLARGHRIGYDGPERGTLRRPIAKLFAPGLYTTRRIMWNGEKLEPYSPGLDERAIYFDVTVTTEDGKQLNAEVQAGPCEVSLDNSKMLVAYAYRLVEETRDAFNGYSGGGVAGWVSLSEDWREYLTTTKDGIADDGIRDALMARVGEGLIDLLARLQQERNMTLLANVAVKLEARLGGLFKVSAEGRPDSEPSDDEEREKEPETKTEAVKVESEKPETPQHDDRGSTEIKINTGSEKELPGRIVSIDLRKDEPIVATVNVEAPHVTTALQDQPVNQMLLASFIVSELALEFVKNRDLMIRARVMTRADVDALEAEVGTEPAALLPFVERRLMDRVGA